MRACAFQRAKQKQHERVRIVSWHLIGAEDNSQQYVWLQSVRQRTQYVQITHSHAITDSIAELLSIIYKRIEHVIVCVRRKKERCNNVTNTTTARPFGQVFTPPKRMLNV